MKIGLFILLQFAFTPVLFSQNQKNPADSAMYEMKEILIVGNRFPENRMEIPVANSVVSKEEMKSVKGVGLDDALTAIPGVLAQSRYGNQDVRISIRGFGARGSGDRSNAGTSRGIRIMMDGIPETEPDGRTSFDMIDLETVQRLEIVRSNGSSVWGNATGGLLNISSVPDFEKPFATIKGLTGSFGFHKESFQTAGNIVGGKIYATFLRSKSDGWRKHSESERLLLNAGLVTPVGENTIISNFLSASDNLFRLPGPLTLTEYNSGQQQANATYLLRDERRFNRTLRLGIQVNHDINESNSVSGMFFVNPKYLQRSERNTFRDFNRIHLGGNFTFTNQTEFTESVKNILIIGSDEAFQDGSILFYNLDAKQKRGTSLRQNKREGANSLGLFIQNEIQIDDKWTFLGGYRVDKVKYDYADNINPSKNEAKTFTGFSPKLGITYRITPDFSVYGSWGNGIEVPAGNETDPSGLNGQDTVYLINPLLDVIKSSTLEIGIKKETRFDNNSLIRKIDYDVAVYSIGITNDIIPYSGGAFYLTAGKSTRMGIEFGGNIQSGFGLSLKTAFTFSSNSYENYKVDSIQYGKSGKFADYSGNKMAGIPDLFYSGKVKYQFELGNFRPFIETELKFTGQYFADDANKISVPSSHVLNLVFGLDKPVQVSSAIQAEGFFAVNNLTDEKFISSAFINPDYKSGSAVYIEPGLPMNFVLGISLNYVY